MKIKEFLNLDEKLITLGNKRPNYNNVVIVSGGAGSGKGFVKDKLLGIEGKNLDVDEIKKLAIASIKFAKRVKDETGYDIKTMKLTDPENVKRIHQIIKDAGLVDKTHAALFTSIALKSDNKPNLIFDVTLKSITKLVNISFDLETMGYEKKNTHIVWVINDFKVALEQNKNPERGRIVPEDILIDTHKGAAATMRSIVDMGDGIKKYVDGDIWFVFNKVGIDSVIAKSNTGKLTWIKEVNYFKIKETGKSMKSYDKIEADIKNKIISYIPNIKTWNDK